MESRLIRVPKKRGEETRQKLTELGVIDKNLKIKSETDDILIPVIKQVAGFDIEKGDFELLKKDESTEEILGYSPAYERIGDIAIIERHEPDAQKVAEVLLRNNKIKTVLYAETSISGEYRTRGVTILA